MSFYVYLITQLLALLLGGRAIKFGIDGIIKQEIDYYFFFPRPTKFSGKTAIIMGYALILFGVFVISLPLLVFFL